MSKINSVPTQKDRQQPRDIRRFYQNLPKFHLKSEIGLKYFAKIIFKKQIYHTNQISLPESLSIMLRSAKIIFLP